MHKTTIQSVRQKYLHVVVPIHPCGSGSTCHEDLPMTTGRDRPGDRFLQYVSPRKNVPDRSDVARGWDSSRLHPANVTCEGPIILLSPSVVEQDPGVAVWLQRGNGPSTVLINVGASVAYDEQRPMALPEALSSLRDDCQGLQVLWKFQ
ncbi:hypothetical protein PG997_014988 [Apiospora hydei]|uniref:Uncharacterized protein n=1 Tax=Apiospora hydei TaxID=1337664 RepID=A0ABR1UVC7_9PEZI